MWLSKESLELLRDASLLQLFLIPDIPQIIPLLYRMIRLYMPDKEAFLLSNYYIKFTVNEVALIMGLLNMGEDFDFQRASYS
ncbi:hypothetical protein KSP40_PGU018745 [Platanthera guangdongensis]|uniref:Uncharacterized protein n=1 Tax=Platanthera guangdongensis TaxID=2320717 RepID=A0ABR2MF23_9ASPA